MLRLASSLAPELLSFQPVYSRLSWSKNYAAKDIKFVNPYTKYKKVLVTAMCDEFCKIRDSNVSTGVTFKDLRKEIKMLIGAVSESLSSSAKKISTCKEIAKVATTWANGDKKIGRVIANAMDEIGNKEGHILISSQGWKSPSIRLVFYSGFKLDQGYISSCFLNNKKKKSQTLYCPMVYVFESKLSDMHVVMEMLSISWDTVLIIAEDFEGDVLDTLITKKLITGAKVCAIRAPGYGETRNAIIRDIHNVTGGNVISFGDNKFPYLTLHYNVMQNLWISFSKVITKKDCAQWTENSKFFRRGSCAAALVSENDTILLHKHYTKQEIEEEITKELRSNPKRIPDKDWLYAVIKVGGPSKENVRKKRCILTHALVAAKAAMEEGIVPGGGIAFLNASKELEKLQTTTSAQKIAVQIIQNALKMPLITIVSTAEVEGLDVVGKLLNQDNPDLGYDSTGGEFVDMMNYGIVDPLKLIRKVFVEATSMFLKKPRGGMLKDGKRTKLSCEHKWKNGVGRIQGKAI